MIGKTISHYKILEKLGGGGMGVVYKAEDTKLDRKVALKFLPPHLLADKEAEQRFISEAKSASSLDHPNICAIHEINKTEDGQFYIVMGYYTGETLKKKLDSGPLQIDTAINYTTQIATGLSRAHEAGIIHRDIKPANIMITDRDEVKILDFGLAKTSSEPSVTKLGSTVGTVSYMSPEQSKGDAVDQRTDIWSLGVVLFEMLTGEIPFKGDYEQAIIYSILNEEPTDPKELRPESPLKLEKIVKRALEKNPGDRYSSMDELLNNLVQLRSPSSAKSLTKQIIRPVLLIPIIITIIAIVFVVWWLSRSSSQLNWVREKGHPELHQLINSEEFFAAVRLAEEIELIAPDDPTLVESWPLFSSMVSISTSASDAKVFIRPYTSFENDDWQYLGVTPIKNIRIPRGLICWKIEKAGFETVKLAASGLVDQLSFDLQPEGSVPAKMVKIPSDSVESILIGMPEGQSVLINEFFMDKYEVTNQQYKKFVDAGGYQKEVYWKFSFLRNGKVLNWQNAMAEFTDATGRAGPANWELGNYPEGKANHPVSGISWFEAAAYAEFVEKELPTVYHWIKASSHPAGGYFLPQSNFGREDTAPVGKYQNIGFYGTYDMAGNVREWCFNQSGDQRFSLGGSWNDPSYMFNYANYVSPFDRSLQNGFRCIKLVNNIPIPTDAYLPISLPPIRNYSKETPVSDEIFSVYKRLYDYDIIELNSSIESVDITTKFWRKEKITFDAAYEKERITVYLFLPKHSKPPYQTIILFPGSNGLRNRISDNYKNLTSFDAVDFTIKSGRAVVYPVYEWMYERGDNETTEIWLEREGTEIWFRDIIIKWRKDLGRTIDYLSTRPDIDLDKLCYYGSSLGAMLSPILLAVEERINLAIFRLGGFKLEKGKPETDAFNFATRVRVPVLMLNGKFDVLFPLEESQQPLYDLWGVSEDQKRMVHFNMGHSIPRPRNLVIKETLDWLDKYLGPVN
jgi:serine/threonine protein kinase/cephalosporin-C deacetylase-like acetyl esterase